MKTPVHQKACRDQAKTASAVNATAMRSQLIVAVSSSAGDSATITAAVGPRGRVDHTAATVISAKSSSSSAVMS
jgi:hypothetical protein